MALRYNPAPGWPPAPRGWLPPEGWQPDPAWPPAPPGWPVVAEDGLKPSRPGWTLALLIGFAVVLLLVIAAAVIDYASS